jgi:hypothetical protein
MTRSLYTLRSAALLLASAATWSCGPGNTGRVAIPGALAEAVPWVNGRPPVVDEGGQVVIPEQPKYPTIATGARDYGSKKPDCTWQRGLSFSKTFFLDFEADHAYPDAVGVAEAWAGHDDDSDGSFRTPGEINWYPGLAGRHGAPWGMPADEIANGPLCNGDKKNEWALHFKGGRYNLYGAGVGHPLALLNPCPPDSGKKTPDDRLCPAQPGPDDETDSAGFTLKRPDNGKPYSQVHAYWDVSGFDGVAFWARRGPEGQGSLTMIIDDKHSSEDLNRENEKYCRRLIKCRTHCANRQPCSPVDDRDPNSLFRCYDPLENDIPLGLDEALLDEIYPRCGRSACTFPTTYPDVDNEGKECRPYTFHTHLSGEYCFNKGDPAPPDTGERCGDGYARTVTLSTDWKFFKLPFKELRQEGYGKVSPYFDLTSVSNIAFVVPAGWADFFLDNVTFYREAD